MSKRFSKLTKLTALILCCFIGLTSCDSGDDRVIIKDGQKNISSTFKAQLKTAFCAFNIVQIKDSAFFNYGMTWTDALGKTYEHVFSVENHCDFNNEQIKVDEIFNCRIVDKAIVDTCIACMGFMETPKLLHNIQVIK